MRRTGPSPLTRDVVYARAHFACEVCGGGDGPFAVHHRRPRGMGGTRRVDTNGPANLLLLCDPCHGWVESRRDIARVWGLLVSQNWDPAQIEVRLVCGWTYLSPSGTYSGLPAEEAS